MNDALLSLRLMPRALRRMARPLRRCLPWGPTAKRRATAARVLARLQRAGVSERLLAGMDVISATLTGSDVLVAAIGDCPANKIAAYLKVPLTCEAERSLTRHREAIAEVRRVPGLASLASLMPRTLAFGFHESGAYHLETALPGRPASGIVHESQAWNRLAESAARASLRFHMATSRCQTIDRALLDRLVGPDVARLRAQAATWPRSEHFDQRLLRLDEALAERLIGRRLRLTWMHGDFWPGNLLAGDDGTLRGILDWDRCVPDQFPFHDLFHLLTYGRKIARGTEAGEETLDYLFAGRFSAFDRRLVDETCDALGLPGDADFLRVMAIIYWLRFAAINLSRYPAFRTDGRWLHKNVFLVLEGARL